MSQEEPVASKPQPDSETQEADLHTISFKALQDDNVAEAERLFAVSKSSGFFYLDFSDSTGVTSEEVNKVFQFEERLFKLPQDELLRYDVDRIGHLKLNGYKPLGRNFGGFDGKDGFETYALPKNGIMGRNDAAFPHPPIIAESMSLLRSFNCAMMEASRVVFISLSRSLRLPPGRGLQDCHRPDHPSPDIVRLLRYHAAPRAQRGHPHAPHTDLGSLTFVFARAPGLQILAPGADAWAFVTPRPGCAIVNLGDAVAMLTNGLFHSCLHRVAPLPGQTMGERYSIAYLVRPEDATPLEGLPSPLIPRADDDGGERPMTTKEWIERKFGVLRAGPRTEKEAWLMTGTHAAAPV